MKAVIKNSDVKYGGKIYEEGKEYPLSPDEQAGLKGFYEPVEEKQKAAKTEGDGKSGDKKPPKGGGKKGAKGAKGSKKEKPGEGGPVDPPAGDTNENEGGTN